MPFNKRPCNDPKSKSQVVVKNSILNEYCTDEEKEALVKNMSCVQYATGEMIFYEHQPVLLIYFINSGKVKLWKEGVHKDEQIIHFVKEGDIIGYWGCLEGKDYTLSATALVDTDICFIKKEEFFDTLKANSEIHFNLLREYTRELKKTEEYLRNMAEMNVREKLAKALLHINNVFGAGKDNSTLNIEVSRHDLGTLAGISIDRASKQIIEFKDEGIISIKDKKISINKEKLKKIIAPYIILDR